MNNITMHDPSLVSTLVDMYFGMLKGTEKEPDLPPTVPGLALHVGFDTVGQMTSAIKNHFDDGDRYPSQSIRAILRALTYIEDYYITNGITGKIPPALVKFTMGAYHDRREQEAVDHTTNNTNNYQIVFNAPKEFLPEGANAGQLVNASETLPPSQRPQGSVKQGILVDIQ